MMTTMTEKPLISVIVPVYNVEKYLPKCMEMLLSQTYPDLEIVLVDDGSPDGSAALCDEYAAKERRVCVYHKPNGGLSDARNYGIERAKGEYITCIDADDYPDRDYVEYLWQLLCENDVKMSICQLRVQTSGGKNLDQGRPGSEVLDNKTCIKRMMYHDVIDTTACAKLYHRSLFENVRYPVGRYFEDIGTTYELMLLCEKIAVGYESKYNYIYRDDSIVNSAFNPRKLDLLDMTDKMAADVSSVYPDLEGAVLRRRVYARFSTLNQMFNVTDPEDIRKREEIIAFILENSDAVAADPLTPSRDRMAIRALKPGFGVYKKLWKLYLKIQKG